ncbi:unnamed protein product, partial [marine sediment metagenome]
FIPDNKYYGMDNLIQEMLAKNCIITKYNIKDYWLDIGQVTDYQKAQEIYNEHFSEGKK